MTGDSLAAKLTAIGATEDDVAEMLAYAGLNKTVVTLEKQIEQERLDLANLTEESRDRVNALQAKLDAANAALRAGVVPAAPAPAAVPTGAAS